MGLTAEGQSLVIFIETKAKAFRLVINQTHVNFHDIIVWLREMEPVVFQLGGFHKCLFSCHCSIEAYLIAQSSKVHISCPLLYLL